MRNTKYDYRRLGEHVFRIRMDKIDDTPLGFCVRYEIQEPADTPRNWWERLKQIFTVSCYHYGYWFPSTSDDSLEDRITWAMTSVVEDWDTQNAAEKEWEAL